MSTELNRLEPGCEYRAYPVDCRGTIDLVINDKQVTIKPDGSVISGGRIITDVISVEGVALEVKQRGDRQIVVLPLEAVR